MSLEYVVSIVLLPYYFVLFVFLVQVQLMTEVLCTPSSTRAGSNS